MATASHGASTTLCSSHSPPSQQLGTGGLRRKLSWVEGSCSYTPSSASPSMAFWSARLGPSSASRSVHWTEVQINRPRPYILLMPLMLNLPSKVLFFFGVSSVMSNRRHWMHWLKHNFWKQICNSQMKGWGLTINCLCVLRYSRNRILWLPPCDKNRILWPFVNLDLVFWCNS